MNSLKQNMHSMTNQLRATCEYIGEMSVLHPPLKMLAMAKWMFPHFQLVLDTIGKRKVPSGFRFYPVSDAPKAHDAFALVHRVICRLPF